MVAHNATRPTRRLHLPRRVLTRVGLGLLGFFAVMMVIGLLNPPPVTHHPRPVVAMVEVHTEADGTPGTFLATLPVKALETVVGPGCEVAGWHCVRITGTAHVLGYVSSRSHR